MGREGVLPAARELRTPLTSVRGSANCTPRQLFPASIDPQEHAGPRRWEPAREGDAIGAAARAAVVDFAAVRQSPGLTVSEHSVSEGASAGAADYPSPPPNPHPAGYGM